MKSISYLNHSSEDLNACFSCQLREGDKMLAGLYVIKLITIDVLGAKKKACHKCAWQFKIINAKKHHLNLVLITNLKHTFPGKLTSQNKKTNGVQTQKN